MVLNADDEFQCSCLLLLLFLTLLNSLRNAGGWVYGYLVFWVYFANAVNANVHFTYILSCSLKYTAVLYIVDKRRFVSF